MSNGGPLTSHLSLGNELRLPTMLPSLTDIVLPTDQSEGTSNTVGKWFKSVGDPRESDEPLLEITTDKVTVEIAAPGPES